MYYPLDFFFYQAIEDWAWDKNTKVMIHRRVNIMENFPHTSFVCAKQPNSTTNVAINYLLARHVS